MVTQEINPLSCSKEFGNPSGHSFSSTLFSIVVFLDYFHTPSVKRMVKYYNRG